MNEVIARTIRHVGTERRPAKLTKKGFIENIDVIRRRARKEIEEGAVTASYKADRNAVVSLLNEALASELTNMLQYRRHYFMAKGIDAQPLAAEFLEHANEELVHADALAKRIVQLGGEPDFSPAQLAERSHSKYVAGESLLEMLREDLIAERIAIDTYRQIIRYVGDDDPTTRRVLVDILAQEEEHADELATALDGLEK
ncbi:MAG: bacterioferritin [Gammaproteobacteria bacterium]|nr:bacterioferritin [Gammaproteobacteria bacterium]